MPNMDLDPVGHQALFHGADDRNASAHAALKADLHALFLGRGKDLPSVNRQQGLVGRDHVFPFSIACRIKERAGSSPPISSATMEISGSSSTSSARVVRTAGLTLTPRSLAMSRSAMRFRHDRKPEPLLKQFGVLLQNPHQPRCPRSQTRSVRYVSVPFLLSYIFTTEGTETTEKKFKIKFLVANSLPPLPLSRGSLDWFSLYAYLFYSNFLSVFSVPSVG